MQSCERRQGDKRRHEPTRDARRDVANRFSCHYDATSVRAGSACARRVTPRDATPTQRARVNSFLSHRKQHLSFLHLTALKFKPFLFEELSFSRVLNESCIRERVHVSPERGLLLPSLGLTSSNRTHVHAHLQMKGLTVRSRSSCLQQIFADELFSRLRYHTRMLSV